MANNVSSEPATKADLQELRNATKADLEALEQKLDQKLDQKLANYATKQDLEGWAERLLAVVMERMDQRFKAQHVELARMIRSEGELTRSELRAQVEELKATYTPRAEFEAHRDDAVAHRAPRRRRS